MYELCSSHFCRFESVVTFRPAYFNNFIVFFQTFFFSSLWGGSVLNLGTKKHRDKYYEGIDNLEYTGCFAMTELHHGILFFWPLLVLLCYIIFPSILSLSAFHSSTLTGWIPTFKPLVLSSYASRVLRQTVQFTYRLAHTRTYTEKK